MAAGKAQCGGVQGGGGGGLRWRRVCTQAEFDNKRAEIRSDCVGKFLVISTLHNISCSN